MTLLKIKAVFNSLKFWVHKDYKKNKIKTKRLNYIHYFVKNSDCDFKSLIAETDNITTWNFYESLGYKKIRYIKLINKEK